MAVAVLNAAADVVRHFFNTENQVAAPDFDADIRHQEIGRFHTDGVAGSLGEFDIVDPGHLQTVESAEMIFFGFNFGSFRRLGGGEREDGEQRRREKGEESFHIVYCFLSCRAAASSSP